MKHKYRAHPAHVDRFDKIERDVNTCEAILRSYETSVGELVEWNPSLDANDCRLLSGYRYCVEREGQVKGMLPSGGGGMDTNGVIDGPGPMDNAQQIELMATWEGMIKPCYKYSSIQAKGSGKSDLCGGFGPIEY